MAFRISMDFDIFRWFYIFLDTVWAQLYDKEFEITGFQRKLFI